MLLAVLIMSCLINMVLDHAVAAHLSADITGNLQDIHYILLIFVHLLAKKYSLASLQMLHFSSDLLKSQYQYS